MSKSKRKVEPRPSPKARAVAATTAVTTAAIPPDGFMTRAEAAAFGRLNVQTIDQAIHQLKTLRAYYVGRRVLIRKTDLVAWIESRQV